MRVKWPAGDLAPFYTSWSLGPGMPSPDFSLQCDWPTPIVNDVILVHLPLMLYKAVHC